jgi:hypothetical protein
MRVKKAEKPRSNVMPRSLLWGFLSSAAVLVTLLSVFASEVFPESICPSTPYRLFVLFNKMFFQLNR